MSKATHKQLGELHGELVKTLTKFVTKTYYDPESGEEMPPPPQILNIARQMLKDNGVEATITPGSPLAFLQKSVLPFDELKAELEETARH